MSRKETQKIYTIQVYSRDGDRRNYRVKAKTDYGALYQLYRQLKEQGATVSSLHIGDPMQVSAKRREETRRRKAAQKARRKKEAEKKIYTYVGTTRID